MRKLTSIFTVVLISSILFGCGKEIPKRDHIPFIKQNLVRLQEAVKEQNRAAIDSLLSPDILNKKQGSDSLLKYVYGEALDFGFEQFGSASITYALKNGRIDCFIMDSTRQIDRPFVLFLSYEHDMWLFSSFAPGESEADNL